MNEKQNKKLIASFLSDIRKNNLVGFKEHLRLNPNLISLKNKKKENILFLAFEKNSTDIIDFILMHKPSMLLEKNIVGLNIPHELIIKNKSIEYFMKKFNFLNDLEKMTIFKATDLSGNNILMYAAFHNNIEGFKELAINCPSINQILTHTNEHGQNVCHILASHTTKDISKITEYIEPSLLNKEDFLSGSTPLMLSALHQNKENFNLFLNMVGTPKKSYLMNTLMHFAALNNKDVVNLLIENNLFNNDKNKIGQTPLMLATSKHKIENVKIIFEKAKEDVISQDELIELAKISGKNIDFFQTVILNKTNQEFNINKGVDFLEAVFLHSSIETINTINSQDRFSKFFKDADMGNLFFKTISGRKNMKEKINLLLNKKEKLTLKDSISALMALNNLPKTQIGYIFKQTSILDKLSEESFSLLEALELSRGFNYSNKKGSFNDNLNIQNLSKTLLKQSKLPLSKQFSDINNWLEIIDDKNIVFKHYGKLISKEKNPFNFIEDNLDKLNVENQKKLIFYAITAILKDNQITSEDIVENISKYQYLLKEVVKEMISFGKIPKNNDLLKTIKDNKFISEEILISLFKDHKIQEDLHLFLKSNINLFQINEEISDDLMIAISGSEYSNQTYGLLRNYFNGKEDEIIAKYISLVGEEKIENFDENILKINQFKNKRVKKAIDENFQNILISSYDIKMELLESLWKESTFDILDANYLAQDMFSKKMFMQCSRIQSFLKKSFKFRDLNFSEISDISIEVPFNSENKELLRDFFIFISNNKNNITEKQIVDLIENTDYKNISFQFNFVKNIGESFKKINSDVMLSYINKTISAYNNGNVIDKSIKEDDFANFCDLVIENVDINVLLGLKKHTNYIHLSEENKIFIEKEILDSQLSIKSEIFIKPKRIKI